MKTVVHRALCGDDLTKPRFQYYTGEKSSNIFFEFCGRCNTGVIHFAFELCQLIIFHPSLQDEGGQGKPPERKSHIIETLYFPLS